MSEETKVPPNPYADYTIEQIMAVEFGKFCIQVGSDLLSSESGKMAFNKERAEVLFDEVFHNLNIMKKSVDEQERKDAITCLTHLRMFPLRIH